jgi:hypothetical protein
LSIQNSTANFMEPKDLLLPLLAALWALCSLVHSGTKELNSIRDRILFPDAGGFRATLPHRNLLARNDWLPLLILLNFACIAFGVVSALSPLLLAHGKRGFYAWVLAIFVGIFAFAMSATLILTGISEWRLISRECLESSQLPEEAAAKESRTSRMDTA